MKKHAFTLIELLSTTAIIAVLMAVMFPVFTQVRNKVLAFTAGSNARQIGMASTLYRSDSDGKFPVPDWAQEGDPQDVNLDGTIEWYEKLLPYFDQDKRLLRVNADSSDPYQRPSSFLDNSWFDYSYSESSVLDPSDTIYITERNVKYRFDFSEWWHWQGGAWPPNPSDIPFEKAAEEVAIFRYKGFNNYLYVDGHTKMRRFEDTWHPRVSWWPEAPLETPSGERY